MSQTENSNQVFLPAVREHGLFSYAIILSHYLQFHIKCNIRHPVERKYISQMSTIDVYDKIKHLKFK